MTHFLSLTCLSYLRSWYLTCDAVLAGAARDEELERIRLDQALLRSMQDDWWAEHVVLNPRLPGDYGPFPTYEYANGDEERPSWLDGPFPEHLPLCIDHAVPGSERTFVTEVDRATGTITIHDHATSDHTCGDSPR